MADEMLAQVSQAMVDAAFPFLHGDSEFKDDPKLRAALEVPVREALQAAFDVRSNIAERAVDEAFPIIADAVLDEVRRRLEALPLTADRITQLQVVAELRSELTGEGDRT